MTYGVTNSFASKEELEEVKLDVNVGFSKLTSLLDSQYSYSSQWNKKAFAVAYISFITIILFMFSTFMYNMWNTNRLNEALQSLIIENQAQSEKITELTGTINELNNTLIFMKEMEETEMTTEETIQSTVEEIKEEVVEAVQEEIKEIAETVVNNEEEKKEETKIETKKAPAKKKGGSRKKATKSEEVKDIPENTIEEVAEIVIPKTTLSYADACQSIRSSFVDEEWDAKIAYFEEKKNSILISNDLNRAQLHDLLAQITTLRDEMYYVYIETKNLYEHLTDKENGLIEVTKKLHGKGSNTEERKVNGIVAVMNYKPESGDTVNLYELLAENRIRYNFLKGLNDSIEFKKMVLLTMLSSLKSN